MIGLIHIVIGSFHVCYVYRGALRRLMHTEVCIGLDIAHFPSLMYGFIMQQQDLRSHNAYIGFLLQLYPSYEFQPHAVALATVYITLYTTVLVFYQTGEHYYATECG